MIFDNMYYILVGEEIKPVSFQEFILNNRDIVATTIEKTDLKTDEFSNYPNGDMVSSVFFGINHQFREGDPILFETMIFGGEFDRFQWRYHTLKEAKEGHLLVCNCLLLGIEPSYNYLKRETKNG